MGRNHAPNNCINTIHIQHQFRNVKKCILNNKNYFTGNKDIKNELFLTLIRDRHFEQQWWNGRTDVRNTSSSSVTKHITAVFVMISPFDNKVDTPSYFRILMRSIDHKMWCLNRLQITDFSF
jgi:hypothetical protein